MQSSSLRQLIAALLCYTALSLSLPTLAAARPITCPAVSAPFEDIDTHNDPLTPPTQSKIDAILHGDLPKEACCSYGRCHGDVVVAMQ